MSSTNTSKFYSPPEFNKSAFNCLNCNVYAKQYWFKLSEKLDSTIYNFGFAALCDHCKNHSIWVNNFLMYPTSSMINEDVRNPQPGIPEDIKKIYKEARSIVGRSPMAAAALLRLAVQKLIDQILDNQKGKGKGKDLNDNIRILGERGLPKQIQLILNYYRIGGNNAVHPGQIDLKDKRKTAKALFEVLNIIVLIMISNPNKKKDCT